MGNLNNRQIDQLCEALLTLKTKEDCHAFLSDALTINETIAIAQRLEVARRLSMKESYQEISKTTGASTATISRVGKCYEYGPGGYKTVLERLSDGAKEESND